MWRIFFGRRRSWIYRMCCRELTVLLQQTSATFRAGSSWTTTNRGLLLDAFQRVNDVKKPVMTEAERILVSAQICRHYYPTIGRQRCFYWKTAMIYDADNWIKSSFIQSFCFVAPSGTDGPLITTQLCCRLRLLPSVFKTCCSHLLFKDLFTNRAARVVLFSAVSVCVSVWTAVNLITPGPLEISSRNFQGVTLYVV